MNNIYIICFIIVIFSLSISVCCLIDTIRKPIKRVDIINYVKLNEILDKLNNAIKEYNDTIDKCRDLIRGDKHDA